MGIFKRLFKKDAYIYGFIFLFVSLITVYSYTWSESVFIFAIIWFASSVNQVITSNKNNILIFLSLILSALLLFFSRYIGAFSFGIIGLLVVYYLFFKKQKITAFILIAVALLCLTVMTLYLHNNYLETGFYTGYKRSLSLETHTQLFIMLLSAMLSELVVIKLSWGIVYIAIQSLLIGLLALRHVKVLRNIKISCTKSSIVISFL